MTENIDLAQDFEVTYDYVESILRTLPISYYTGRDIDVQLSKTSPSSFYQVLEDTITISYINVIMIVKNLKSTKNLESHVRGILYHEISHAILTPDDLMYASDCISTDKKLAHDVLNIFEDERIETILRDTFYGVNFKEGIIALNGWKGPKEDPPKDALGAFYQIVRFRTDYVPGRKEFLKRVADIINCHRKLTKANGDRYYGEVDAYAKEISNLFWDISKDWMEKNKKEELDQAMDEMTGGKSGSESDSKSDSSYDKGSEEDKKKAVKRAVEKEAKDQREGDGVEGNGTSESGLGGTIVITKFDSEGSAGKEGESVTIKGPHGPQMHGETGEDNPEGAGREIELSDEELQDLLDAIKEAEKEFDDDRKKPTKVQEILSTELNKFVDQTLTDRISDVFENFLSRNKNNSAAMMRYSGVLDPRLIGREDWRIWKYKSTNGPIKGFDKLHLNLFIDTSGSYRNNEDKTNTILKTLDTLEHKYPFFSFDLVTCQISETLRNKKQRYIQANGGNRLDDKIFKIYNDLQHHDSFNYNIVLFDGDAFTDCSWGSAEKYHKNFGAFNSSKCSIISDFDNKDAIEKYAPQAHTILVKNSYYGGSSRKSYADMLFDNILEAMNKALM